jgi:pimeloyl-ACP methyl ester carboxylesterase
MGVTLPDARLIVIEGSGHFPPLERPDVFFPAVNEFLSGDWPEPTPE